MSRGPGAGLPEAVRRRTACAALPVSVVLVALAIAILHQDPEFVRSVAGGLGKELAGIVWPVAAGAAALAVAVRRVMHRRIAGAGGAGRRGAAHGRARLLATIVPLAILEAGALVGLLQWMVAVDPRPGLVAALVLLAAMMAMVPWREE